MLFLSVRASVRSPLILTKLIIGNFINIIFVNTNSNTRGMPQDEESRVHERSCCKMKISP